MRLQRIPLTFRNRITGDLAHTTIPGAHGGKSPDALLALCRRPAHTWSLVGRSRGSPQPGPGSNLSARIGIVLGTAWPDIIGGGELVWRDIGIHMQRLGFDVHVFASSRASYGSGTLRPVAEIETATVAGMAYHYVPEASIIANVQDWAREARPSAIWTTFGWDVVQAARLTSLRGMAPLVVYQQFWQGLDADTFAVPEGVEFRPEWAEIFAQADTLVANSGYAARRFAHASQSEVPVITPPTDDALGESSRDGAVLLVGSGPEKGTDVFRRVAAEFPDHEFIIIGEAPDTLGPNCSSIGWADPRPYYQTARALLAPSLVAETYGMAVEEARKWGIPTIVSNNGALADHAEIVLSTARVGDWIEATARVLDGDCRVAGAVMRKQDALRGLEAVMTRANTRPLSGETFPSIATYSGGDGTSVDYASRAMLEMFGLSHYTGGDIPDGVQHVLLQAWSPAHASLFSRLRSQGVHPWVVVHSPAAQGELDGEHRVFSEVMPLGSGHILACHAPLAKALGARWLPVPTLVDELAPHRRGPRRPGASISVGMWNTWRPRKNTWTQVLAMRELARISGREVVIHGPMVDADLCHALGGDVRFIQTEHVSRREFYERMADMDLSLQVTHAESFNYCAMESTLLGVPCLVGPGTPAGRFGLEAAFVVADPTDPILIAQMAHKAIQDAERCWFHERMIRSAQDLVDYRHRGLRDTLEAIERGGA
ncbi:MAG: glycosyltransferase family 4 protein [bacterium]|nr:glycosyltransferase family 4 protein [bacterium]